MKTKPKKCVKNKNQRLNATSKSKGKARFPPFTVKYCVNPSYNCYTVQPSNNRSIKKATPHLQWSMPKWAQTILTIPQSICVGLLHERQHQTVKPFYSFAFWQLHIFPTIKAVFFFLSNYTFESAWVLSDCHLMNVQTNSGFLSICLSYVANNFFYCRCVHKIE